MAMAAFRHRLALSGGDGADGLLAGAAGRRSVTVSFWRKLAAAALRAGALGIIYALAIAVFGGSAQFIVTWLIDVTGSPLAPAWYMTGALVLGVVAMLAVTRNRAASKLARASALSCQRCSSSHSSSRQRGEDRDAGSASSASAANMRGDLQPVAGFDDAPGQARWRCREPATNSATTAPISARPPPIFMPVSR